MPILSFVKNMTQEVLYAFHSGEVKESSTKKPILFVDMDHTIIKPKGGRVHPKGADDWEYLFPDVIPVLQSAIDEGYIVYVISNQSSLLEEKKAKKLTQIIEKISTVFAPIIGSAAHAKSLYIAVACSGNYYRKPHTGLYRLLVDVGGVKVDLRRSIFCGDALGRTSGTETGKADFSASDYYFALNCGIPVVYTPRALFGAGTSSFSEILASQKPYEPATRVLKRDFMEKLTSDATKQKRDLLFAEVKGMVESIGARLGQIMIVLTGSPASGKSTLVKLLCEAIPSLACYSGDELKTRFEKSIKDGLKQKEKKSVLIDSTNPSKDSRKKWIEMAKEAGVTPISIYIPFDEEITHHLQHFRIEEAEGTVEALPEIAIRIFKSKYERPYKVEGFEAVFEYTPYISFPTSKSSKSKSEENFQKYY